MAAPNPDASPRRVGRDALLDDPALAEALADCGALRLSNSDVRAMRAARRRTLASGAAAALLFAVGLGGWWNFTTTSAPVAPVVAHYETRRGQQIDVALSDGSTLRLNGATSLDVTIADSRREVALHQGEAFFDVAHDPARPFLVHAGDSGARVLGTAFDVNLTRGRVELAVYRGAVRFGSYGAGERDGGVVVKAGWRSRFGNGSAREPTRFDVAQEDWRQGWLDTEDMRLGDVVEALNREGGPLVQQPPAALADMPIAGRFKLDDPVQLLNAIGPAYGFRVVHDGDHLSLAPMG